MAENVVVNPDSEIDLGKRLRCDAREPRRLPGGVVVNPLLRQLLQGTQRANSSPTHSLFKVVLLAGDFEFQRAPIAFIASRKTAAISCWAFSSKARSMETPKYGRPSCCTHACLLP